MNAADSYTEALRPGQHGLLTWQRCEDGSGECDVPDDLTAEACRAAGGYVHEWEREAGSADVEAWRIVWVDADGDTLATVEWPAGTDGSTASVERW